MRKLLTNPWPALVCRLIIGGILLFSVLDGMKILQPQLFADAVDNYRIVPRPLVNLFALVLLWAQLVVGLCLVTGIAASGAALVSSGMFALFIAAIASAVARGLNIECGCFNLQGASEMVALEALWWRAGLLVISLVALYGSRAIDWPARLLMPERAKRGT